MERRKFVIGMGALATGTAAAVSSGAFTSVDAERDLEIDVVQDNDALLAMGPTEHPNSAYLVEDGTGDPVDDGYTGGTIAVGLDDVAGEGVNNEAITYILDIFYLRNQGTQDVWVDVNGISPNGNLDSGGNTRMMYRLKGDADTNAGSQYAHPEYGSGVYHFGNSENRNPVLSPGDEIWVGIRLDTRAVTGSITGDGLEKMEISAYELGLPE